MNIENYDRFVEDGQTVHFINNEEIQCANCVYKTDATSSCKIYKTKPKNILQNLGDCEYYRI